MPRAGAILISLAGFFLSAQVFLATSASEFPGLKPTGKEVTVQHIFIGLRQTSGVRTKVLQESKRLSVSDVYKRQWVPPKKKITRSKESARSLAERIFERANAGEDFESLVTDYSDDVYPGIFRLVEAAVAGRPRGVWTSEVLRVEKSLADVAFGLQVGEVGLARYHRTDCRFGWHIIRRLE